MSPPTRSRKTRHTSRSYHHGDLRVAVLSEARRTITRKGFEEISLRTIADKLGVAPNALYRHFHNKDALLALLAKEGFQKLAERLRAVKVTSPLERFRRIAAEYVNFARENPETLRLMFGRVMARLPKNEGLGETARESFMELLRSASLVAGVPLESRRSLGLAIAAWSLVHGYANLITNGALDFIEADRCPSIGQLVRFIEVRR